MHPPPIDPKEVTKICLRLKHQIEQVIPYEIEEEKVTKPNSPIITSAVLETASKAGGGDAEKTACVVYCLLMVKKWFKVSQCESCAVACVDLGRNKLPPNCGMRIYTTYAPSRLR